MNKQWFFLALVAIGLQWPLAGLATQSDSAKERRWAEQIVESLFDGDAIWLRDAKGHEFLGILTSAGGGVKQAVILAHGIGVHPNWPDVIFPLRESLLEAGITSLSIQMPVLANDAPASDYAELLPEVPGRFRAAQQHLTELGYQNTVIVAHSLGATMAVYYLSTADQSERSDLIVIGMGDGLNGVFDNTNALDQISLNLLDLYGSRDLDSVLTRISRSAPAEQNNRGAYRYDRIEVDGAGHFFSGYETELTRHVIKWLEAAGSAGRD